MEKKTKVINKLTSVIYTSESSLQWLVNQFLLNLIFYTHIFRSRPPRNLGWAMEWEMTFFRGGCNYATVIGSWTWVNVAHIFDSKKFTNVSERGSHFLANEREWSGSRKMWTCPSLATPVPPHLTVGQKVKKSPIRKISWNRFFPRKLHQTIPKL